MTIAQRWKNLNRQIIKCDRCERLIQHCQNVAVEKRKAYRDCDYWGKPVPNFSSAQQAKLLVVGLAPGAHGANRTGRMFTGDRSGEWLYRALYRAGFANQPESIDSNDGLQLINCVVTNVCHCAPPGNKPVAEEISNCRSFLDVTIEIAEPRVILALGKIAWDQMTRWALDNELLNRPRPKFGHAQEASLSNQSVILASYHPSQQNTFTKKLTESMLDQVMSRAAEIIQLEPI